MDIIEFCRWVEFEPTPVQRVILKAIYGLTMDTHERSVRVSSDWTATDVTALTEADYLQRLREEGRCNWQGEGVPEAVWLSLGRRSGKSTLGAVIMAYDSWKLAEGKVPGDWPPTNLVLVGAWCVDQNMARLMLPLASEFLMRSPARKRVANQTQNYLKLQTDQDIERHGPWEGSRRTAHASVKMGVSSASAKGLRGNMAYTILLEEYAHFPKSSAEMNLAIAEASCVTAGGRVLALSTPHPSDKHNAFRKAFEVREDDPRVLCMKIPTWEARPEIPGSHFEEQRNRLGHARFMCECGAEFIENLDLGLPDTLYSDVEALAKRHNLSVEDLIVQVLREKLGVE